MSEAEAFWSLALVLCSAGPAPMLLGLLPKGPAAGGRPALGTRDRHRAVRPGLATIDPWIGLVPGPRLDLVDHVVPAVAAAVTSPAWSDGGRSRWRRIGDSNP
jgi:hypothetical protein